MVFDASGDLFVTNYYDNTVSVFTTADLNSGDTLPTYTIDTDGVGPDALAFDPNNNLFVTNYAGDTVSEFTSAQLGNLANDHAPTPTILDTPLYSGPDALAFDSTGDVFVGNFNSTTVCEFYPGSTTPNRTLTGVDQVSGLAFRDGDLFAASINNGTISEFNPGSLSPNSTLTGLNGPNAMEFDSNGNLFVQILTATP